MARIAKSIILSSDARKTAKTEARSRIAFARQAIAQHKLTVKDGSKALVTANAELIRATAELAKLSPPKSAKAA